jgi:hypothetical protein
LLEKSAFPIGVAIEFAPQYHLIEALKPELKLPKTEPVQ